jgi:hypothetical protein
MPGSRRLGTAVYLPHRNKPPGPAQNAPAATQGCAWTPDGELMDYARKKLTEMKWWHRFRLAVVAVLGIGAAGFFLYCLGSIAEQSLEPLEQVLVPESGSP